MNSVKKKRIVITYWVWEPYEKTVADEEMRLLSDIKEKKILQHIGYPKVTFEDVKECSS